MAELAFLLKLKQRFPSNPQIYREFEKLLTDLIASKIDARTMAIEAQKLLNGHADLVQDFSNYLQTRQHVHAIADFDRLRIEATFRFIADVENSYAGQPRVIEQFMDINESHLEPVEKLKEIVKLFHNRADLVQAYRGCMPRGIDVQIFKIDPPSSEAHQEDREQE